MRWGRGRPRTCRPPGRRAVEPRGSGQLEPAKDRDFSAACYGWLDASLRYVASGGQLSVLLWVKNATDVFRPAGTFALATAREIGVTYLQPRTYGIQLGYTF